MQNPTATTYFETDPEWYVAMGQIEKAPTDVLIEVHKNARKAYFRAGGHQFANRMQVAMNNIEIHLWDRERLVATHDGIDTTWAREA